MANSGPVAIQGCAFRISRLNAAGNCIASTTGIVQDDKSLMKFTASPTKDTGVEFVPKSACGALLIAYKDRDRTKRWDIGVDFGDWDFEKMEMISQHELIVAPSSAGRTFADGMIANGSPYLVSPALASFVNTDVGRQIVGFIAPSFTSAVPSGSGGTILAGTWYYVVTATGLGGETLVSNELSAVTTGSTSSVVLTWASVASATGYNIYKGSTSGGELLVHSVGAVTTYTDVAPDTPTVAPPTVNTTSPAGIPSLTYVLSVTSPTQATMSAAATATSSSLSVTLHTLPARTVGSGWPSLLSVENPDGVAIEIWQKAIVRGTGYQGSTPYPHAGSSVFPILQPSAWIRFGAFRCYLDTDAIDIEDKEGMTSFKGWAIENPGFGLGPMNDWTTAATAGQGVPVDTTRWATAIMDFQLPGPLQAGYQTSLA
jgi:hypothetical protein